MAGRVDYYVGVRWVTIAAAATLAAGVAAVPLVTGGGGAPDGTANLWVDTDGGTCTRQSAPAEYVDAAACSSPAVAWNAATAGDTIRVTNGTYSGLQNFTSDKASETFLIGEGRDTTEFSHNGTETDCGGVGNGFESGPFCFNGNNMTLQDVTLDSEGTHGQSNAGRIGATNVRWENVRAKGTYVSVYNTNDTWVWSGGVFGESGVQGQRHCSVSDGEPIWLDADATIEYLYFYPQGSDQTPHACSSNGFHLEHIRVQSSQATVRNVYFADGAEAGSGHLFYSGAGSATGQVNEGNYFGALADGSYAVQVNATVGASCAWIWRYNTFREPITSDLGCHDAAGATWTGNLGVFTDCGGTRSGNVYQAPSTNGCSGWTHVTGADDGTLSSLNVDAGGRLEAGSEAIDAAGATCATVTPDFDGTPRPQSTACDAGAFERLP